MESILREYGEAPAAYKRNLLKEYLQVLVLEYIYSDEVYRNLAFYGGSCLAQCYGLPRLSEDVDFVDLKKDVHVEELAKNLKEYFRKKVDLDILVKTQKFRIYLKFPVLHELKLAGPSESDMLYVKVEIFDAFNFCSDYMLEMKPLFKFNKSILIRTFDLSTLMATKIRAVLNRKWEKTDKSGRTIISVKGRDYFDLMWYLERGIKPNMKCIEDVQTIEDLKKKLLAIVEDIDTRSIVLDLENFIDDATFTKNLGKNIKDILKNGIEGM